MLEIKEEFKDRLDKALTIRNIKPADLARKTGITEATISQYRSGYSKPKDKRLVDIANVLHVDPAWLMGLDVPMERTIQLRNTLIATAEENGLENAKNILSKFSGTRVIPVYGRVAAGIPMEEIQDITDWEEIPDSWVGEYMALRVKGDSMLPRIEDGDVIIARLQSDAESGDVVVAQVNGCDATVKKLIKHQNGITLQAYNPAYDPMFFNEEEQMSVPVRIIGKVVELRGKF